MDFKLSTNVIVNVFISNLAIPYVTPSLMIVGFELHVFIGQTFCRFFALGPFF